ncbi:Protein of unknown function [Rhodococcus triatomae]|uniref:DUF3239 domain-containing protein n=1 Tax=Rhodococcus triatomae TaxID=300028 RepID=A0A1G8AUS5_9NOCA|nr:Protein of unknown function [Rhodococcus triatomae]
MNQTLADMRRLQVSSGVVALALTVGAVVLFVVGDLWSTILGVVVAAAALTCIWLVLWVPRKVGSIEDLYANGPLVPAVVGTVHPRGVTLLSLIDVAKPGHGPTYALVTRNIPVRPKQRPRVGDRVPSVGLLNDRTKRNRDDTWEMVSLMPVEWGTRDVAVHARAEAQIPDVEWQFLASRIDEAEQIRTSRAQRQVLPIAELPDELR